MLIISHKSSRIFKEFLSKQNLTYIETIDNPNLDPRIADHPDLSLFALDDETIVIDSGVFDYYKDYLNEYKLIKGDVVGFSYPYDSIYNVYRGSSFYIHNDITESHIIDYMDKSGFKHLYTKQGYTRCSIIPMGDKILTSDYGIYKSLKDELHIILLPKEDIPLDGFPYGFLGGTCGQVDDKLIFNGDIRNLKSYDIIVEEANKSNIKLLYPGCELVDTGSILHIRER